MINYWSHYSIINNTVIKKLTKLVSYFLKCYNVKRQQNTNETPDENTTSHGLEMTIKSLIPLERTTTSNKKRALNKNKSVTSVAVQRVKKDEIKKIIMIFTFGFGVRWSMGWCWLELVEILEKHQKRKKIYWNISVLVFFRLISFSLQREMFIMLLVLY